MIFRKIGEKGEQVPGWEKKFACCMGYNKSDKILYIITQQFSEKLKEE